MQYIYDFVQWYTSLIELNADTASGFIATLGLSIGIYRWWITRKSRRDVEFQQRLAQALRKAQALEHINSKLVAKKSAHQPVDVDKLAEEILASIAEAEEPKSLPPSTKKGRANSNDVLEALSSFEARQVSNGHKEFWINFAMSVFFFVAGLATQPLLEAWFKS